MRAETTLESGSVHRYRVLGAKGPLSYRAFLEELRNRSAALEFASLLADSPFPAFRWETPPLSTETATKPMLFVLVEDAALDCAVDRQSFREHFRKPDAVVSFQNLSRKSTLIVPTPPARGEGYGHLASFVRRAPAGVIAKFWQEVAEQTLKQINAKPLWLSTAGGGVAWLHVRIDPSPKYYRYRPFKVSPGG